MEAVLAFLLFLLLSPGMLITLPPGEGSVFDGSTTNHAAVLVHTVAFFVLNKMIENDTWGIFGYFNKAVQEISKNSTPVPILLATMLFALLSPGFIFNMVTLRPMAEDTDTLAVVLHAIGFYVLLRLYVAYKGDQPLKWIDEQLQKI